ncbi:hypothetical protein [Haloarcula sp. H-GB5]
MDIDFRLPDISPVSITVVENLNLSWGDSTQNPDDNSDDDDSDGNSDSAPAVTDIWGKSPRAKRWEKVDRPYHPGDRR